MVLGHVGLINWWGWGYSMCNNVPIFVYFFQQICSKIYFWEITDYAQVVSIFIKSVTGEFLKNLWKVFQTLH